MKPIPASARIPSVHVIEMEWTWAVFWHMCKGQSLGETPVSSFVMIDKSQFLLFRDKIQVDLHPTSGWVWGKFIQQTAGWNFGEIGSSSLEPEFTSFVPSKAQHVQVFLLPHLSLTTKMLPKDLMNGWLLVCGWNLVIELIESCKNISDSISEWSPQNRPRICAYQWEDTHHKSAKSASLRTTSIPLNINFTRCTFFWEAKQTDNEHLELPRSRISSHLQFQGLDHQVNFTRRW